VQQGLEGSPCQILVRLRAGRRFYADPSLAGPPAHTGRPRRHGPKMKCAEACTWPQPSTEYTCEDAGYGAVRVRAWANLHPKVRAHEGRGSRGPLPIVVGTLVLVEVERLPRGERRREPRGFCGCGGMVRENPILVSSGERTSGASIWSIPSACSNRLWGGPPLGCVIPSRQIGGRGWSWPPSRNYAWLARALRIGGCRGRDATIPAA
jgi:hypothetical protein